jgi:hypothetical protein
MPRAGIALIAVALIGADDSSCSTETKDKPEGGGAKKGQKAKLGDAITLEGTDNKMRVTVSRVTDPLPAGEFDQAESGNRFVGVQMVLANVGAKTYRDAPSNGAKIVTASDEQADPTILTGGPCSGSFASDTTIAVGAKRTGCIPFEVPQGHKLKTFQFALDSGFGPQSGEWRLR